MESVYGAPDPACEWSPNTTTAPKRCGAGIRRMPEVRADDHVALGTAASDEYREDLAPLREYFGGHAHVESCAGAAPDPKLPLLPFKKPKRSSGECSICICTALVLQFLQFLQLCKTHKRPALSFFHSFPALGTANLCLSLRSPSLHSLTGELCLALPLASCLACPWADRLLTDFFLAG